MISATMGLALALMWGTAPSVDAPTITNEDSAVAVACSEVAPSGHLSSISPAATKAQPYYIIGNYECVERNGDSSGACQVSTNHADSCKAACEAHKADVRSRDVCEECVTGRRYPGRRWNGTVTFSQGGPCYGMTCRP